MFTNYLFLKSINTTDIKIDNFLYGFNQSLSLDEELSSSSLEESPNIPPTSTSTFSLFLAGSSSSASSTLSMNISKGY